MATFRSGLKIFSELTLRQSIGRIRSFSEDRRPGSWLPEDQWAVRPPCSTCPDPCAPKKPPKPSKSWLSICKDPEPTIPCDIRHNNCPPPETKDEPWYAFITKKKPEKPKPPLNACRLEARREAENPTEEYCEDLEESNRWPDCAEVPEPEEPVPCERPPAPVVKLYCPTPVDLDLMMWCSRPGLNSSRIAPVCQSDKMPYEEFRPKKAWKPPPFSLPTKCEAPPHPPFRSNVGRAYLSEYKQIEIPKPLYTRYKSVELEDEHFLLCMTDAKCSTSDDQPPSLAMQPPPIKKARPPPEKPKRNPCPEKPVLVAASRKPVKLRCAPKFKFRPKTTKLVEKRRYRNPCAQHATCNLSQLEPPAELKCHGSEYPMPCDESAPKVITGTLTDEPQTYCRNTPSRKPPSWMFMLSKPGSKDTPLVPHNDLYPSEPDWCGETDGLKFYDGQDEGIHPKPPPDPCQRCVANRRKTEATPPSSSPPCPTVPAPKPLAEAAPVVKERFVLMPENYNIRNLRPPDKETKDLQEASFQEFIDAKTSNVRACSKLYPQMKENILYDLARNCPLPPFDPTKADPPPRRPPQPECPQPMRFYYRRYSTFGPHVLRKPNYAKVLNRMKSEDSSDKCKPKKLVPPPRECPQQPDKGPTCNEMEMPCCPKARIPPRCDVKRPLPPCKKKLAPKPSYSECAKDPPPCPKITECNAWEKRETESRKGPSKGRKFSNWAPEQERALGGKNGSVRNTKGANPDGLMVRGPSYSEYLDLKDRGQSLNKNKGSPHKQRKLFSGKELMLNFVNSTEDTKLRYKSDSQPGRRKPEWGKLKKAQSEAQNVNHSQGNQLHEQKVITALLQDHHTRNDVRLRNLKINDKAPALAVLAQNEETSFMGSIGSWISALVTASKNRSRSSPPALNKGNRSSVTYVETVHVDRIMKLTKPFTHTLKSRSYESLCYYPVDIGIQEERKKPSPFKRLWGRNRNRSASVFPRLKRQRALSSLWKYESLSPSLNLREKIDNNGADKKMDGEQKGRKALIPGKFGIKNLEKYSLSTGESLGSRTLLLNVNGSRSGVQKFHSGNGFSCYTATKAVSGIKKSKNFPKRTVSRLSLPHRGTATFNLSSSRKPAGKRAETKSSSDLVEVKGPQLGRVPGKKKINGADSVEPGNMRFRKSATTSIMTNVKVRREFDGGRIATCIPAEKAVMPLPIPQKPWIYMDKGYDYNNVKYDMKKTIANATVIKNMPKKWFHDMDKFQNGSQFVYDGKNNKKAGKDPLKDDLKYCADKQIKRQEVKNMLSKLELKKNVFKVSPNGMRTRQKNLHRNDVINILDNHNASEKRNGRFEWQHSLFRSNPKQPKNSLEHEKSEQSASNENNFLVDVREAQPKVLRPATLNLEQVSRKVTNNVELYDAELDVIQCVNAEDESLTKKEKAKKQRSVENVNFPPSLSLENKRRPLTAAISRSEAKPLQAVHHLRRFSSENSNTVQSNKSRCSVDESIKKTQKAKENNCGCPRCGDKENAEKERGGEESHEHITQSLPKIKKPGPNCPDD